MKKPAIAYVVIAIAAAGFAARAVRAPYLDGDLFWQKHLGAYVIAHRALPLALGRETFSAPGAPWVAQEWLFGIAVWLATQHHALWLLGVGAALAVAAALALTVRRAEATGASGLAVAACVALLCIDVEGSFGIRAQVFAWPLFAALLYVLDLEGVAPLLAIPLVALWANVHASALIAIPLVWIDALVAGIQRGSRDAQTWLRIGLCAAVPLAVLATPLGIRLPLYAFNLLLSPIRHSIDEWQPVGLHHDFFWLGGAPMLLVVALAARTLGRERPRDVAWAAPFALMALGAVRNVPLFGFVVAPPAARGIDVLLARFSWWPLDPLRSPQARRIVAGATALVAAVVFVVALRVPQGKSDWTPPAASLDALAAIPGEHRLFCFDFAICSVALDYPSLRVFMDGRADPYPLAVWNDFNTIRRTQPGWQARLRAYGVDEVLAKRDDALDRALAARRDWITLPDSDRCCRAYHKRRDFGFEPAGGRSRRTPPRTRS